jgi:hypothetical protein
MRHLMWILTWIAVGIGGALGAASVLMVSATKHHGAPSPSVIAGTREPVFVSKPKNGGEPGRSLIASTNHRRSVSLE